MSEVEKTARFIRHTMIGSWLFAGSIIGCLLLVVFGCLFSCIISGIFSSMSLSRLPTTPTVITTQLTGKVTLTDPAKRQIGLQHESNTGQIPEGNHLFDVAATTAFPNIKIGQKVVCTVESISGRWVVTKVEIIP
jgi:Cu/Ag efflux protein CusF